MGYRTLRWALGAMLAATLARGAAFEFGSEGAPLSGERTWSAVCSAAVGAEDDVTVWLAEGATLRGDAPLAPRTLALRGTGAVRLEAEEGFAPAALALGDGLRATFAGRGHLGRVDAASATDNSRVSVTVEGEWTADSFAASYQAGAECLTLTVPSGARLTLSGTLDCGNTAVTVAGRMRCLAGVVSAGRAYRTGWVTVLPSGTLEVTGDYEVANLWAAHVLTVKDIGCLSLTGTLRVDGGKTDSGTKVLLGGTLRAAGVEITMAKGLEADFSGGALILSGDVVWQTSAAATAGSTVLRLGGTAVMAPKADVALRVSLLELAGLTALSAWPETCVTLAPGSLSGDGTLGLGGNLGTVDVGLWRPPLEGILEGRLRFLPSSSSADVSFALRPTARGAERLRVESSDADWHLRGAEWSARGPTAACC